LRICGSVVNRDKMGVVTVHLKPLFLNFYYIEIRQTMRSNTPTNSRVSLLRLTQITARQRLCDAHNYNLILT